MAWAASTGLGLAMDVLGSLGKSLQSKIVSEFLGYACEVLGDKLQRSDTLKQLIANVDKHTALKCGCLSQSAELTVRGLEQANGVDREHLSVCFKSLQDNVGKAALEFIKNSGK